MAYDCKEGRMMLEWANEAEFLAWLAAEESEKTIELSVSKTLRSDSSDWRERRVLRCLREFTGGKYNYQNKNQWERKIPSKKTGCQCRLTIKWYLQTEAMLGKYEDQHDHPLSDNNLQFIRLLGKIRNLIMDMVYLGIDSKIVVSHK